MSKMYEHTDVMMKNMDELVTKMPVTHVVFFLQDEQHITEHEAQYILSTEHTEVGRGRKLVRLLAGCSPCVYDAFCECLELSGRKKLLCTLRGQPYENKLWDKIQKHYTELTDNLPATRIVLLLYHRNLLTEYDKEDILSETQEISRARMLLGIIEGCDEYLAEEFCMAVEDCGCAEYARMLNCPVS